MAINQGAPMPTPTASPAAEKARRLRGCGPSAMPFTSIADHASAHRPGPAPWGEWCGQAEWTRFARLIHRHVRVVGGPAVRAAHGGNLKLP
jgi:hypothetical protein